MPIWQALLGVAALLTNAGEAAPAPQQPCALSGGYDVSWNRSSPNATGFGLGIGRAGTSAAYSAKGDTTFKDGMPLGNGDMVALAWANVTSGGVSMYIRKADAMDGQTNLQTLGLLHVALSPNPFEDGAYFNQTLHLATATVSVLAGGSSLADHKVVFDVRVQAGSNRLSIGITSRGDKYALTAYLDPVRAYKTPNATHPAAWCQSFPADTVPGQDCPVVLASAAEVDSAGTALAGSHSLVSYIRNLRGNVSKPTFVQQALAGDAVPELASVTPDYWTNSQTGLVVRGHASDGSPLNRSTPDTLLSGGAASGFELSVDSLTRVTPSSTAWIKAIGAQAATGQSIAQSAGEHRAFWRQFWQRSYIDMGEAPEHGAQQQQQQQQEGQRVSLIYQLTRFVQAVQSRTRWPIKFNGMLFSANRYNQTIEGAGPDNRNWGGANWWQNLRLPYWTMFASGDWDTLETVFKYYKNMLPLAEQRTLRYFNHTGIFFTETKLIFGAWGGISHVPWKGAYNDTYWLFGNSYTALDLGGNAGGTEVAFMLLNAFEYTRNETLLEEYLPLAKLTIDFFRQHYRNRTTDGKMVIWPTQSLETYWCSPWDVNGSRPPADCCVDDMPTVGAMYALLEKMRRLPQRFASPAEQKQWAEFQAILPPLPTNATHLLPAAVFPNVSHNSETPEMYAVHPWRLFSIGRKLTSGTNLSKAITSFNTDPQAFSPNANAGWCQGLMQAALLGLPTQAWNLVLDRAQTDPSEGLRFPGFAPPVQDSEPSADHFANMMQALQWMLVQPGDDAAASIIIFPAWPCSRAVKFKLAAPGNTTVELDYDGNGALRLLNVQPAARNSSLIFANCVAGPDAATAAPQHFVEKSDDDAIAALAHMRSRSRSPHATFGQKKLRELKARIEASNPPPPPPPCPPALAAEAQAYGWISVKSTGAIGNMTPVADTAGIELAINMTKSCGTNTVWFPPAPGYQLTHTLIIDMHNDGVVLQGSSGAHGWGVDPPLVGISQCACSLSHPCAGNMTQCNFTLPGGSILNEMSPVIYVNASINGVVFNNLNIAAGQGTALKIANSANVRVRNCGIIAGARNVPAGVPGYNVRLNSDNAALVVLNCFWLWFEQSSFRLDGQLPAIVMRGQNCCDDPEWGNRKANTHMPWPDNCCPGPESAVYLVSFKEIVLVGGVQYQQNFDLPFGVAGWFDFVDVSTENTAFPLLDVQSDPRIKHFPGLIATQIINFGAYDPVHATPVMHHGVVTNTTLSVISVNVTQPDFVLDGITMIGAAEANPAIRVWDGKVRGAMLLNQGGIGAHAVLDAAGKPTGSYVGKSDTGFVLVAPAPPNSTDTYDARLTHEAEVPYPASLSHKTSDVGGGGHALLFGLEGESTGRLAIDSDGSMHFGAGAGAPFDTTLKRQASASIEWNPPPLKANSIATSKVVLAASEPGDIATCSHSTLAGLAVQLSCVAAAGEVELLLRNVGTQTVDVASGMARVAVTKFGED